MWKRHRGNLKLPPRRVLTGRPELLPKISQQAISIADCKAECHSLIFVKSIRIRNLAPSHRDVPSAHSPWRHWEWSVMLDLFQEAWVPVPESKKWGFSFLKIFFLPSGQSALQPHKRGDSLVQEAQPGWNICVFVKRKHKFKLKIFF